MELKEAIKAKGLNQRSFAAALGVTEGRVSQWLSAGRVPVERCQEIQKITGIPLHKLRPDIYPAPAREDAA